MKGKPRKIPMFAIVDGEHRALKESERSLPLGCGRAGPFCCRLGKQAQSPGVW